MKRIEAILKHVSLENILKEYKTGHISEKTNKIINDQHVDIELIQYGNEWKINFYEEDDDDVLIAEFDLIDK